MTAFALSTLRRMNNLRFVVAQGSAGNLSGRVRISGTDELAGIGRKFEKLFMILSSLVADVRSASAMVTAPLSRIRARTSGSPEADAGKHEGLTNAEATQSDMAASKASIYSNMIKYEHIN